MSLLLQVIDPQLPTFPVREVFEVAYAFLLIFTVRGYMLLILVGMTIFATGLGDSAAKQFVILGVGLCVLGPVLTPLVSGLLGLQPLSIDQSMDIWIRVLHVPDAELVGLALYAADAVSAVCFLVGAILYFNPASGDLKERGHSLMVRSLILAPVVLFLHLSPLFQ